VHSESILIGQPNQINLCANFNRYTVPVQKVVLLTNSSSRTCCCLRIRHQEQRGRNVLYWNGVSCTLRGVYPSLACLTSAGSSPPSAAGGTYSEYPFGVLLLLLILLLSNTIQYTTVCTIYYTLWYTVRAKRYMAVTQAGLTARDSRIVYYTSNSV
jgi:type IV secretory pathway VirB3-like protein